ncbi:MAG: hypothetical protein R3C39_10760 [Dehalococcoidia bacterium]
MKVRLLTVGCALLALSVVACGDSGNDTSDGGTAAATESTAQADAPPTSTAEEESGSSSGGSDVGPNSARVVIDGQTYLFALDEGGSCNPDFFGGFRAILTRVDESGAPVPMAELPGGTQGITISLGPEGGGEASILANLDTGWQAGLDPETEATVESYSIDGNRAEGTATLAGGEGTDTVSASFEVQCSG